MASWCQSSTVSPPSLAQVLPTLLCSGSQRCSRLLGAADFIPTKTGLKIMGSVPRTTAALAILRICICQHPQQTMAPATADSDQLGVAGLYCLILDNVCDSELVPMQLWLEHSHICCTVVALVPASHCSGVVSQCQAWPKMSERLRPASISQGSCVL